MEFKITKVARPRFSPIKVELVLQEPNDLFYLCAALNINVEKIMEQSAYLREMAYEKPNGNYNLWCKLDEIAEDWITACRAAKTEPSPGYSNLFNE